MSSQTCHRIHRISRTAGIAGTARVPRAPRVHRHAVLCAALLAGFALPVAHAAETAPTPQAAVKSDAPVTFAIPAGTTLEVLEAIARQSGAVLNIDPTAAGRQRSPAINGQMPVRQAVLRAIDGTGLTLGEAADGALTIANVQQLDVVHVYAQRDKAETRFKADRSDTATRSGADLSEIPQSVTIITSKVLETQQARTLYDALRNVSGLSFSQSPQGAPQFNIRALNASVTSNGLTDTNAAQGDAFAVERVEVLKGPQAILSGGDSMGGGVNVVTKKPQAEALQSFLLQYGSHGDATAGADLTGMVGDDKRISYRLIGSAAKARSSEGGYDGRSNASLTPQLRWKDASTDLTVGAAISRSHQAVPLYTYAVDGVILPRPAMKLSADSDGFDARSRKVFYQLEQQFSPDLRLISRMQYLRDKRELHLRSPGALEPDAENPELITAVLYGNRSVDRENRLSGDHYLRASFETAGIGHKLSVGLNHTRVDFRQNQWTGPEVTAQLYPAVPQDLAPVRDGATTPALAARYPSSQVGVYAQDLMNWGDWNLLLNLRRTKYTTGPTSIDFLDGQSAFVDPKSKVFETTPGAGLIYNLSEQASLYASYQQGFEPQFGLSCQNTLLPPIRSKSKELGAKFDLLDGRLSMTAAAFDMKVSNSTQFNALDNCYTLRPGTVTRGLELDLQGELARGLSAIANYTFSKARDPGDATQLYAGLPRHKLSLWGTYALPGERLQGWSAGLGLSASSRSEGSNFTFDRFQIPGQAQWDVSVFYERDGWSATLGVKNLFDRLLYDVSTSSTYVPIKEGRNFMVSLKKTFN